MLSNVQAAATAAIYSANINTHYRFVVSDGKISSRKRIINLELNLENRDGK